MNRPRIFRWDDGPDSMLRALIKAGDHSFAMIAAEIAAVYPGNGDLTRNACIGRAHRTGLCNPVQVKRKPSHSPTAESRHAPARAKRGGAKPRPKVAPHPFPPRAKPIEAQVAEIVFAPGPDGVTFMQQRDGLCRFPISVETDFENARFCGCLCKLTQPYCDEHTAKAYQARQPRPPRDAERERSIKRNMSEMFFKDWV